MIVKTRNFSCDESFNSGVVLVFRAEVFNRRRLGSSGVQLIAAFFFRGLDFRGPSRLLKKTKREGDWWDFVWIKTTDHVVFDLCTEPGYRFPPFSCLYVILS